MFEAVLIHLYRCNDLDQQPKPYLIEAFLVIRRADGKTEERPVADFIAVAPANAEDVKKTERFIHEFLFAGSRLHGAGKGPKRYFADSSGHVISLATFGDEVLCLPGVQSHAGGALPWQVDSTHLPKVGTKVTLRLRPKKEPRKEVQQQ